MAETTSDSGARAPDVGERSGADLYLRAIRANAVRVLSLMDRERVSPTYGCMDRTHWAWKFTDFPGARFQEGLCVLGFLWATPLPDSSYAGNEQLLGWLAAGFDFWSGVQRAAGDFDEAYPFEHSLAATAFTSFYLSEAYRFVEHDLPPETAARFREGLARAAGWLCANDETHGFLSNHLAAASAALYHAAAITGEARFETRGRYFLDKVLSHQSDEGWFDEYGGADPGYQTHGSFYLARILELGGPKEIEASLDRSFRFLAHFVHPDHSLGGEYASRNTQTYYPAAFEMMCDRSASAAWIAREMRPAIASQDAAGAETVDIYNLFPTLNNHVFAYRGALERQASALAPEAPDPGETSVHFPEAGLLKLRRPRYDLYVGLHKGGVFKLFDRERRRLVLTDCGFVGRLRAGGIVSSQWIEPERVVEVTDAGCRIEGEFYRISQQVMDPYRFLAFRVFGLTFGRLRVFAYWLKALLVRVLIYRKKRVDIHVVRRIDLRDDGIDVTDQLRGGLGDALESLEDDVVFTTIHMGSSRYFVPHELVARPDISVEGDALAPGGLAAGIERRRSIRVD